MSSSLPLRHFTIDEYQRMAEAGVFSEDDRLELIEGEIVMMTPIGSRHVACVNKMTERLAREFAGIFQISVQNPVQLGDESAPEPDLVLLEKSEDYYAEALPRAEHLRLAIEVAEASLETDREVKIPLYARHGIPQAWLVNLKDRRIEVFTEPAAGGYARSQSYPPGETIPFHDRSLRVDDLLP